jgi:hypothetical protein
MHVSALVVLRHAHPIARLHFHKVVRAGQQQRILPCPQARRHRGQRQRVAAVGDRRRPLRVFVSSAAVLHFLRTRSRLVAARAAAHRLHWSCHNPWSWSFPSTVQANVSPVDGFTASVPR